SGVGLLASLLASLTLMSMLAAPGAAQAQAAAAPGVYWVYVGTYTGGSAPDRSRGIYLMEFDTRTGQLGPPSVAAASPSPSVQAVVPGDPSQPRVSLRGERGDPGTRGRRRQRLRD